MTQPLALVCYEKLLPGSQLANRLQDAGYQVKTLTDAAQLVATAEQHKPLVVLVDLASRRNNVCNVIAALKAQAATRHLPVIAFSADRDMPLQDAAREAGATLAVGESGLLLHLQPLLDRALEVK